MKRLRRVLEADDDKAQRIRAAQEDANQFYYHTLKTKPIHMMHRSKDGKDVLIPVNFSAEGETYAKQVSAVWQKNGLKLVPYQTGHFYIEEL